MKDAGRNEKDAVHKRPGKSDGESKGQYGGLKNLGPGGGSDPAEASDPLDDERPDRSPRSNRKGSS